jgi:hypothetical protein
MPRYFTLEEANHTLEQVAPLVEKLLEIRKELLEHHPELLPVLENIGRNGGSKVASQMVEQFHLLENLVHEIEATGALVKDINSGLLDFPSLREGHEVYLCWQYGEGDIRFWHEIDGGFAGRQPI